MYSPINLSLSLGLRRRAARLLLALAVAAGRHGRRAAAAACARAAALRHQAGPRGWIRRQPTAKSTQAALFSFRFSPRQNCRLARVYFGAFLLKHQNFGAPSRRKDIWLRLCEARSQETMSGLQPTPFGEGARYNMEKLVDDCVWERFSDGAEEYFGAGVGSRRCWWCACLPCALRI